MVHARAFSFYDDALSVALPSPINANDSLAAGGSMAKPASPDASIPLFKLRQLQSAWYQTLFQSDPTEPLPDSTSFIWQMCADMREWSEGLPDNMPIRLREMLDLELRYSYVYCLAPSARAPHLTPYGRVLIFEHVVAYINRIYDIANAGLNTAFYTYHDALRVYFMGSQFVAILRDARDHLLSGPPIPIPLSVPGKAPPPPIPQRLERDVGDNLDRSLRCLERVRLTLKLYGDRWDDALSLMDSFDAMSADLLESLNARRAMRDATTGHAQPRQPMSGAHSASGPGSNSQYHTAMPQHPTQPQPHEVRWMDVDISQIIRRGGQI